MLGPGDFLGVGALAAQRVRMCTATAMAPVTILSVARQQMLRLLRDEPDFSDRTLAEMIGTTRSRVNFFMNKFRKLGFIEYNGGLKINTSLLSVVLHD